MSNLAQVASRLVRRLRRRHLASAAWLQGRGFFCETLSGQSATNLCINSDLTVSCSEHDVEGTARIGDLSRQRLAEVFAGETAQRFRDELAVGSLPLAECARCCSLRDVTREEARAHARHFDLPQFVAIENTSACNLRCTSCPRKQMPTLRRRTSMSLEDVQRIADDLKSLPIRHIGYLGFGEPFLSKTIGEELAILRRVHPGVRITTSTNVLAIDSDTKREAAMLLDAMQISLHGMSQETAARYQRGIDFDRAYENMRRLVEYRDVRGLDHPRVVWKYLLFRWNERREQLKRALGMAVAARVDELLFEKTVSPFYGLPWRYYLGLLDCVGRREAYGIRIVLR